MGEVFSCCEACTSKPKDFQFAHGVPAACEPVQLFKKDGGTVPPFDAVAAGLARVQVQKHGGEALSSRYWENRSPTETGSGSEATCRRLFEGSETDSSSRSVELPLDQETHQHESFAVSQINLASSPEQSPRVPLRTFPDTGGTTFPEHVKYCRTLTDWYAEGSSCPRNRGPGRLSFAERFPASEDEEESTRPPDEEEEATSSPQIFKWVAAPNKWTESAESANRLVHASVGGVDVWDADDEGFTPRLVPNQSPSQLWWFDGALPTPQSSSTDVAATHAVSRYIMTPSVSYRDA
uniref:Uncharacterized protein n=1 Tax=Noctiluca scintillans TaxID=2966 RepID=A0A7S0ZYR3_NOCSC